MHTLCSEIEYPFLTLLIKNLKVLRHRMQWTPANQSETLGSLYSQFFIVIGQFGTSDMPH